MTKFHAWIASKYRQWRGDDLSQKTSKAQFAAYVGVSQPLMSRWLLDEDSEGPTSQKVIAALYNRYGEEVYEVLGIQPPNNEPDSWLIEQRDRFAALFPDSLVIIVRNGDDLNEVLEPGQEYVFVQRASKAGAGVVLEIKKRT